MSHNLRLLGVIIVCETLPAHVTRHLDSDRNFFSSHDCRAVNLSVFLFAVLDMCHNSPTGVDKSFTIHLQCSGLVLPVIPQTFFGGNSISTFGFLRWLTCRLLLNLLNNDFTRLVL